MSDPSQLPDDLAAEMREMEQSLMKALVKLRKKQKMSQEPIAKATGLSQARVSQMENLNGGVTLEALITYASVIGAKIVIVPAPTPKKRSATSD